MARRATPGDVPRRFDLAFKAPGRGSRMAGGAPGQTAGQRAYCRLPRAVFMMPSSGSVPVSCPIGPPPAARVLPWPAWSGRRRWHAGAHRWRAGFAAVDPGVVRAGTGVAGLALEVAEPGVHGLPDLRSPDLPCATGPGPMALRAGLWAKALGGRWQVGPTAMTWPGTVSARHSSASLELGPSFPRTAEPVALELLGRVPSQLKHWVVDSNPAGRATERSVQLSYSRIRQASMALTPGSSPKRALASRLSMVRPV